MLKKPSFKTPLIVQENPKLSIFVGVLLFLILLFMALIFFFKNPNLASNFSNNNSTPVQFTDAPKVQFFNYNISSASAALKPPTQVKLYDLKTDFSNNEILDFAKKLGLSSYTPDNGPTVVVYNYDDPANRGLIQFDKTTGSFSYESYGVLKPSIQASTPTQSALNILTDLNLNDSTLVCDYTYQRQETPTQTYVECHHSWAKLGLPLTSLAQSLNLTEDEKLISAAPGNVTEAVDDDPTIQNVKQNGLAQVASNGRARPADFNTVTVGVNTDGSIQTIVSNLRWITSADTLASSQLITPQEALTTFKNNQADIAMVVPEGRGVVDLTKVFHHNTAIGQDGNISEFQLIYLEKTSDTAETQYLPYYLIRGYSELDSGYNVRFAELIKAIK